MIAQSDVYKAYKRIRPYIWRTPLIESPSLSRLTGGYVALKAENLQLTGSFKPRGAANKLLSMQQDELRRGVITASTGNHGRAVAQMARMLGTKAVICISEGVPQHKRDAILAAGGEPLVCGATFDEAVASMQGIQEARGLTMIRSFEDPFVVAGHGTIGIELLEDMPEIDTVLIPAASGGMLMGVSAALKGANPALRVVAVSMERGSVLVNSLRAGRVVDFVEEPTLADALMGGLGTDPEFVFNTVKPYIDDTALVSEEEIAAAMAFALNEHHLVLEGAGATGIAALLSGKLERPGAHTAVVLSGGNVHIPVLLEAVRTAGQAGRA